MSDPSRRQFLASLVAFGAALIAPGITVDLSRDAAWSPGDAFDRSRAALTELFGDLDNAQAVGAEYLRLRPEDADRARLLGLIAASIPADPAALRRREQSAVMHMLEDSVRRDFEHARMIQLRGWMLSITEARLCALSALA